MKPEEPLRSAGRGAMAGAVAALVMSIAMYVAQRAGLMGQMPPRKITSGLLRRAGVAPQGDIEGLVAALAHVAFGAAAGLAFAEVLDVTR